AGYAYDGLKRLSALVLPGGGEIRLSYDEADRLTAVEYPNGVRGTWRDAPSGQVAAIEYVGPGKHVVAGWDYAYAAAGNPTQVQRPDRAATTYRYDPDGRLVEETSHAHATSYAYAPGGNRSATSAGNDKVEYQYEHGRLVAVGQVRLSYD